MGNDGRTDVVVVGAGIAGLTAACHLVRGGCSVALLEAGGRPGGLTRSVSEGGISWDLSLYGLRGAGPGEPFETILRELGILEKVPLRQAPRSCLVRIEDDELPFSTEHGEMLAAAERITPGGSEALGALIREITGFNPVRDYASLVRRTFADVASGIGERLLAAFSAPLYLGLGLPPERASAYFSFLKYRLLLSGGVSRPEGGADALVAALANRFLGGGGVFYPDTRVEAVDPGPDSDWTVSAGSRSWRGAALVLAVDAAMSLSWLSPPLPRRAEARGKGLLPALPATVLLCAAPAPFLEKCGFDRAPQLIAVRTPDLRSQYMGLREGMEPAPVGVVGLSSPSFWGEKASGSEQPFTAFFLSRPLSAGKVEDSTEDPIRRLRTALGDDAAPVRLVKRWTPGDFAELTGSPAGSFCGWEMGPERYGRGRIPQKLPLNRVWLAGHWTDPGPSVLNAALSGRKAALGILGER